MYTIRFTGEFKRQMKLCKRRGLPMLNTGTHSDLFGKNRR